MVATTLTIECDASAIQLLLDGLLEQLAELPLEIRLRIARRFESIAQPFRLDVDRDTTAGAGNCCIVFQPSEALLEFASALRARQFDF